MNVTFKYNSNGKYLTKDLTGEYNDNNFSLQNVSLNKNGSSDKTQLLNFLKNHHIVTKPVPIAVGYSGKL